MAPAHDHHHDHDDQSYYVGQLCAIGICGALGGVAVVWWARGLFFLAPAFQMPVLIGGSALLILVAVRAVSLWITVGKSAQANGHSHEHHHHEHCDHAHEHCGHDHDHAGHTHTHAHTHEHDGHEHGSAPWRYAILLLPIVLFFLGLPNTGFSSLYGRDVNTDDLEEGRSDIADKGFLTATFQEIEDGSYTPSGREYYEGRTVRIVGQFSPNPTSNRKFNLVRFLMVHCAADAIRLNMVIESPQELNPGTMYNKWVEVTGKVSFRRHAGRDEYVAVLTVPDASVIKLTNPPSDFFLFKRK